MTSWNNEKILNVGSLKAKVFREKDKKTLRILLKIQILWLQNLSTELESISCGPSDLHFYKYTGESCT